MIISGLFSWVQNNSLLTRCSCKTQFYDGGKMITFGVLKIQTDSHPAPSQNIALSFKFIIIMLLSMLTFMSYCYCHFSFHFDFCFQKYWHTCFRFFKMLDAPIYTTNTFIKCAHNVSYIWYKYFCNK